MSLNRLCGRSLAVRAGSTLLLTLAVVGISGCADPAAAHKTGRLLEKMHEQMNGQDWDTIYKNADDGFRKGVSYEDFKTLFIKVHKTLGDAGAGYTKDTQVESTFNGMYVSMWLDVDYTRDPEVHEHVVWHQVGPTFKLYRYDVDSKLLK
jgi:hypothetical protein